MNIADKKYNDLVKRVHEEGIWDKGENVRAVYDDGTSAHSKSIFGVQVVFEEGELPILTSKKVFWKTALKEMLLFWQKQTVSKVDFEEDKVKVWDEWFNENGNLGRSYAYQFESHRHHERDIVKVENRVVEIEQGAERPLDKNKINGIGIIGDLANQESSLNVTIPLWHIWKQMLEFSVNSGVPISKEWLTFSTFLKEVKYLPQYFLAKEDNFKNWSLDAEYYRSNIFSKETCVFTKDGDDTYVYGYDSPYRRELSRNQVVELLNNLINNPQSRRLGTSFWNYADVNKKELQECAHSTLLNVKEGKLDMILIQRSADIGLGLPFNWIQYYFLLCMLAQVSGLKVGRFIHQIGNLHYYDRHEETLLKQIENKTYATPKLVINTDVKDFFDFKVDDIKLVDYESGEYTHMEVAI